MPNLQGMWGTAAHMCMQFACCMLRSCNCIVSIHERSFKL